MKNLMFFIGTIAFLNFTYLVFGGEMFRTDRMLFTSLFLGMACYCVGFSLENLKKKPTNKHQRDIQKKSGRYLIYTLLSLIGLIVITLIYK